MILNTSRNIILTGFMGTGKTTVGQIVADFIGWHFVDSDDEIVQRIGKSVADIFAQEGEAAFRRYERIICQSLAARESQVIATGGGMLVDPANRELMLMSGLVICLTAAPDSIQERLESGAGRPLATNWQALEALLEQRKADYAAIPYQIDTTGLTPQQVAEKVVALWKT